MAEVQLNRFLLLTYADLKAHKYYYWFAFPALVHPSLAIHITAPPQSITTLLSVDQCSQLVAAVKRLTAVANAPSSAAPPPFFLIDLSNNGPVVHPVSQLSSLLASSQSANSSSFLLLGFIDSSSLPSNPGWPLRNFLLYAAVLGMRQARVLCFRDLSFASSPSSIVLDLTLSVSSPDTPLTATAPTLRRLRTKHPQQTSTPPNRPLRPHVTPRPCRLLSQPQPPPNAMARPARPRPGAASVDAVPAAGCGYAGLCRGQAVVGLGVLCMLRLSIRVWLAIRIRYGSLCIRGTIVR